MIGAAGAASVLGVIANAALAIWLGGIVFFSFVATPALFRALDREEAGRAVRAVFPSYYRLGAACGGVFVGAMTLRLVLVAEPAARSGLETVLGSVMLALTLYAWRILLPDVESARVRAEGSDPTDRSSLERSYFGRLHALSVRINATVLVVGLVCLALRLTPR